MSSTSGTSSVLEQLSNDMAGAVERAGRGIVRVNGRRRLPATGVVWSVDGDTAYVVSANHVVERDEDITVTTPEGGELPAELAGRDSGSDIVLLRVQGGGLTAAERSDGARVGELVLALGRAAELAATVGVVSASSGPWQVGRRRRRFDALISTDAPMFPGFSGGPLVDAGGRVLGVVSSHLGRGQTLAIPNAEVERIVTSLKAHGRVRRGYLGIGAQQVSLPAALRTAANTEQEHGLLLVAVEDDGPAAQAGLMLGDIIVAVGGQPVEGLDGLRSALSPDTVGTQVSVRIARGGEARDVTVTVGEHE